MKNRNILFKILSTSALSAPLLAVGLLSPLTAFGFESFVVKNIRLEGLQRISEGTVYNYLPVHVGESVSDAKTSEIIRGLFKTGFFKDVQIGRDGDTLVIQLKERPAIGSFKISGNKDVPTENLMTMFKQMGLVEGQSFDRSALELIRNELEKMYFSHGKYAVKVETKVSPLPRNRVKVEIVIDEGFVAKIKQIHITGNHQFTQTQLVRLFELTTPRLFSWYTHTDEFDKQKLSKDVETLRSFYMDKGYLNFKHVSTQVSISPDKQDICITINIFEGDVYKIKKTMMAGDSLLPECEFSQYLKLIQPCEIFSRAKIIAIAKLMTDRLGNEGYAYAHIDPIPELNEETKEVSITFRVDPGKKINVRRVDFVGNVKTEDTVMRKYSMQLEGAPISTPKVEGTKARYNRTGFFSEVEVETVPVPGIQDQVDLVYSVKEAASGQVTGGIGYSSADKFLFNASISNRNVLGTGKNLDLSFNNSRAYTTCSLSYNDPFYTLDGVSRGFSVFYSKNTLGNVAPITHYNTDVYGANVNWGIPLNEYQRLTFALGAQDTRLTFPRDAALPTEILNFLADNSSRCSVLGPACNKGCHFQEANIALAWTYNALDRYVFPQKGVSQSLSLNMTLPFSDLQYYKINYNGQYYHPLGCRFIGLLLGNAGYGYGYGKTDDLPFFKNYYLGGPRTLRGYDEGSLGPKDSLGKPFGGNFVLNGTAALILPEIIAPGTNSVRTALFVDGGQVYHFPELRPGSNPDGFRYAAGVSFTWISPIGPLVLNFAYPLNFKKGDDKEILSITFGTIF